MFNYGRMVLKKYLIRALGILAVMVLSNVAFAAPVTVSYKGISDWGVANYTLDGEFRGSYAGKMEVGLTFENQQEWLTYAFCVDLYQPISYGSFAYETVEIGSAPGTLEAAWLADQYAGITGGNTTNSAALQMAIWSATHDQLVFYDDPSGDIYETYLDFYNAVPDVFSDETVTYLESRFDVVVSGTYQDLLVYNPDPEPAPTPEPVTLVLFGIGLVGLSFLRKRFNA